MIKRLADEIRDLHAANGSATGRVLLGLTGCCGSGKSTLAGQLCQILGDELKIQAAVLALDGFHFPDRQLNELGLSQRKGSPATFDLEGFFNHVRSVRDKVNRDIAVPTYSRELHEPIPGGGTIVASTQVVIVEGNYLLLDGWREVAGLLDQIWYLDTPLEECMRRVRDRHRDGGCDQAAAALKIETNDRLNAELVRTTLPRADRVIAV